MKRFILILTAALLAATTAYAGWWRTFGGTDRDEGTCVQQTSDGGYIVTGVTWSFGTPNEANIWLIKLDSLGHKEWDRAYEAGWGRSVRQTSDGGYIIAGSKLIKTDEYGDTNWTRPHPCRCVQETDDKHYIITGGGLELMKVSVDGDSLWARNYEKGNAGSGCSYIEQTSDGGFILTGTAIDTLNEDVYKASLWLLKTDENGDTIWTKTYGGDEWDDDDDGNCVRETADNGYIITGYRGGSIWLLKTDNLGDTLWTRTYGGGSGYCVEETPDGNYILTGEGPAVNVQMSLLPAGGDLSLLKVDNAGDTIWGRSYGGEETDVGRYVQQTTDEGYTVVGYTRSFGAGGEDVYLLKADSLGLLAISEPPIPEIDKNWEFISSLGPKVTLRYEDSPLGFRANIYDALGRMVDELFSPASSGIITWGAGYPSGVYFIRVIEKNNKQNTARIVLIR